jgi:hypothetical protein
MKGQVSAEMLILLAVVVAVVAIAATYIIGLGKSAGEQVDEQGQGILSDLDEATLGDTGDPCIVPDDCKSGNCGQDDRCT